MLRRAGGGFTYICSSISRNSRVREVTRKCAESLVTSRTHIKIKSSEFAKSRPWFREITIYLLQCTYTKYNWCARKTVWSRTMVIETSAFALKITQLLSAALAQKGTCMHKIHKMQGSCYGEASKSLSSNQTDDKRLSTKRHRLCSEKCIYYIMILSKFVDILHRI